MQIPTIRNGLEAFECKFYPFERNLKHSIANSNHWKGIRSIRMQIRTIWKGFEAFECKFQPFERDSSKHSNVNLNLLKWIQSIRLQILTIQKGSKHSNEKLWWLIQCASNRSQFDHRNVFSFATGGIPNTNARTNLCVTNMQAIYTRLD